MGLWLRIVLITVLAAGAVLVPVESLASNESVTKPAQIIGPKDGYPECWPIGDPLRKHAGHTVVSVIVEPDGSVSSLQLPPGSPHWVEAAAHCTVEKLRFKPGTVNSAPVQSQVFVPVVFASGARNGGPEPELVMPTVRSTVAEVEAAYRDCYPFGLSAAATIAYRMTVGVDGRARGVKVNQGSADRKLEKAGACVLRKLQFTLARYGSEAMKVTIAWNLLVRPPAPE